MNATIASVRSSDWRKAEFHTALAPYGRIAGMQRSRGRARADVQRAEHDEHRGDEELEGQGEPHRNDEPETDDRPPGRQVG